MLSNPSRILFYFLVQILKFAVNIDGYLPNSDITKIEVTEKSYDFVTFSHNSNSLFKDNPIHLKSTKNKNNIACKSRYWIFIIKGKKDTRIT
ncbi:hypothetical protein C6497_13570 [Candidatus Poribacteria bacterium]|nr:MAG: hypothetical protein C6497_13570 [Candidatus Poribacteria bacterium]